MRRLLPSRWAGGGSLPQGVLGWNMFGSFLGQVGFALVVTVTRMRTLKIGTPKSEETWEDDDD